MFVDIQQPWETVFPRYIDDFYALRVVKWDTDMNEVGACDLIRPDGTAVPVYFNYEYGTADKCLQIVLTMKQEGMLQYSLGEADTLRFVVWLKVFMSSTSSMVEPLADREIPNLGNFDACAYLALGQSWGL